MKVVYRAANITEAEIIRGMLASEGIDSHVSGFYLQGGVGELAPTDTARIMVNDDDLQPALTLLHEYDPQVRGDNREQPPQETFLQYLLAATLLVALIGFLVFLVT